MFLSVFEVFKPSIGPSSSLLDVYPTLLELTGITVPDETSDELDGASLVPLLLGNERHPYQTTTRNHPVRTVGTGVLARPQRMNGPKERP